MKGLATAALIIGLLPAAAQASTARVEGGTAVYSASPGELNNVRVSTRGDAVEFHDFGADIAPGAGCAESGEHAVRCTGAGLSVRVEARDGNDVAWGAGGFALEIDGGAGADQLRGADRGGVIRGGPGDDILYGAAEGGTRLDGGEGDDTLRLSHGSDILLGGDGDDWIDAGAGEDGVDAGPGADRIATADGAPDSVACGDGNDLAETDAADAVAGDCDDGPGGGPAPRGVPRPVAIADLETTVGSDGRVEAVLACPSGALGGCSGDIALRVAGGRSRSARMHTVAERDFSLRAGSRRAVTLRLPRPVVQRLRRQRRLAATAIARTLRSDERTRRDVVLRAAR